jgi:hypothetical protein
MIFKSSSKLSIEEILKLAKWTKQIIRQGVEVIKAGRKLNYLSTNDLDENNKLKKNYLELRKKRQAKKEKDFIAGQVGRDVY